MERIGKSKLAGQKEKIEKPALPRFGRLVLSAAIITSILFAPITGCTATRNGTQRGEAKAAEKAKQQKVSVEGNVTYQGRTYGLKVEAPNNGAQYLNLWGNGEYIKLPFSGKFKKFEVTKIVIGDPTIMAIGTDEKGNYAFEIYNIFGEVIIYPIVSQLSAKRLQKLGIRLEISFNAEKKLYTTAYYDREGKLIGYATYSEEGKQIENEDLGLMEIVLARK